ncbi:hypothetical protein PUN28_016002 [Cardiocondyla obscurior]|uniref:Uncharacterized protein n=1 Tax=Cardiocondyla obscurior TaxID=286306 RepID=A0AAW2ESY5_9HYME
MVLVAAATAGADVIVTAAIVFVNLPSFFFFSHFFYGINLKILIIPPIMRNLVVQCLTAFQRTFLTNLRHANFKTLNTMYCSRKVFARNIKKKFVGIVNCESKKNLSFILILVTDVPEYAS